MVTVFCVFLAKPTLDRSYYAHVPIWLRPLPVCRIVACQRTWELGFQAADKDEATISSELIMKLMTNE